MKKYLMSCAFLAFNTLNAITGQAMIFEDRSELDFAVSQKPKGTFEYIVKSNKYSTIGLGTCLLIQDKGQVYGLTSAHAINLNDDYETYVRLNHINGDKQNDKRENSFNFKILEQKCVPNYKDLKDTPIKDFKNDLGIFKIDLKNVHSYQNKFYHGELSKAELKHDRIYRVTIGSLGQIFSNNDPDVGYGTGMYHEARMDIVYNDAGYFEQKFMSDSFYFKFKQLEDRSYKFDCGIVPSPRGRSGDFKNVASIQRDSGSVAFFEGKPIAIHSGNSFEEFYAENLFLAGHLKQLRHIDKQDPHYIQKCVDIIYEHAAKKPEQKKFRYMELIKETLYIFELKDEVFNQSPLKATVRMTPIKLHQAFIDQFLSTTD